MEKRVLFKSAWLPWVLIAPQMAVILVFFFWPAGQALYQSVLQQDAFGATPSLSGWRISNAVQGPQLPGLVQDHGHVLAAGGGVWA
jgi:ABC-type sugar transport system permease subunit